MFGMEMAGGMFGGGLVMVLWWLLPIAVIAALGVHFFGRTRPESRGNEAFEILRQRYARGEIGLEEFGRRKRELGS